MFRALLLLIPVFVLSCSNGPREIDLGTDACSYCKMSIVDAQFAAQMVTKKGKIYTYDAIECLVNDLPSHDVKNIAHQVIKDFSQPAEWIEVRDAAFVIDSKIQSPMGANLAGFSTSQNAVKALEISADSLLTWEELKLIKFDF